MGFRGMHGLRLLAVVDTLATRPFLACPATAAAATFSNAAPPDPSPGPPRAALPSPKTAAVTVNGDTEVEPNELFLVNLSVPTGLVLADTSGSATIQNDD